MKEYCGPSYVDGDKARKVGERTDEAGRPPKGQERKSKSAKVYERLHKPKIDDVVVVDAPIRPQS